MTAPIGSRNQVNFYSLVDSPLENPFYDQHIQFRNYLQRNEPVAATQLLINDESFRTYLLDSDLTLVVHAFNAAIQANNFSLPIIFLSNHKDEIIKSVIPNLPPKEQEIALTMSRLL